MTLKYTVQLKGNVTLMLYSLFDPQELDTLYLLSNTHNMRKGQVIIHSRRAFSLSSISYQASQGLVSTPWVMSITIVSCSSQRLVYRTHQLNWRVLVCFLTGFKKWYSPGELVWPFENPTWGDLMEWCAFFLILQTVIRLLKETTIPSSSSLHLISLNSYCCFWRIISQFLVETNKCGMLCSK